MYFKNKTNQIAKEISGENVSRHQEAGFSALHKESTIPRWSHCYNPIIYRIKW
jgi:hypothetical protein